MFPLANEMEGALLRLLQRLFRRPETMTVEVTWNDIFSGHKWSPYACPIAHALARDTGRQWTVSPSFIWDQQNAEPWVDNSLKSAKFIRAYDTGQQVRPTTLTFVRAKRRSLPLG